MAVAKQHLAKLGRRRCIRCGDVPECDGERLCRRCRRKHQREARKPLEADIRFRQRNGKRPKPHGKVLTP